MMKNHVLMMSLLVASGSALAAVPGYDTLIAHRGESHAVPENTLPAYKLAVERGFGFECDIYRCKDGTLCTFHDHSLKRTTGGADPRLLTEVTWDEVKKVNVGGWGKWKGSDYDPTRPARLEEVLALARPGRKIYVEVKAGDASAKWVPDIKAAFARVPSATPDQVVFIAFGAETVAALKREMPEYKAYLLSASTESPRYVENHGPVIPAEEIVRRCRACHADGIDIHYVDDITTAEYFQTILAAGLEVHCWTIDRPLAVAEAFRRGAMTVTTNVPKQILDELADGEIALVPEPAKLTRGQGVAVNPVVNTVTDPQIAPEGYRLTVTPSGVEIASADAAGEFYARQTLRQLRLADGRYPCVEIRDAPRLKWRGLLLDECRHFFGKAAVKRLLDLMAQHKLNRFHWHLTDDQAWRLEIPGRPELVKYGAVRSSSPKLGDRDQQDGRQYGPFYYTEADVREIIAYAAERHIEVMPEIEFPGHFRAALAAYPEFACNRDAISRDPFTHWGICKDVMCVGNDAALAMVEQVLDYVARLFPCQFVHIGGDECPTERWQQCAKCQARIRAEGLADAAALQAWVTGRFVKFLEARGKRVVGWDEFLQGEVPPSAIGMNWRSGIITDAGNRYLSTEAAIRRGHDMFVVPWRHCYLCLSQDLPGDRKVYNPSFSQTLPLKQCLAFDPFAEVDPQLKSHILGSEICVWNEYNESEADLDWEIWPRACALAEVFWKGPGGRYSKFIDRMNLHRQRLLDAGVKCAPLR